MEAPKCRICGKREYSHSCGGAESLSNLPNETTPSSLVVAALKVATGDDFCPSCGTNLSAKERERERRRKWMKDKRKHGED